MRFLTFYLFGSLILADSIENIPFDWGGQFGYVSHNGIIQWNKDWNSNRLLFDGTWSVFPRMYGSEIDKGFVNLEADGNVVTVTTCYDNDCATADTDHVSNKISVAE